MPNPDPEAFLPLSPADFHILVALKDSTLHGYAIMRSVEETSVGRVRIEVGSLYRMIGKLLTKGLIRKVPNPDDTPRPGQPRQCYALSPLGFSVLRTEVHRLHETMSISGVRELLAEGEQS